MRISNWSSDVCSSDLLELRAVAAFRVARWAADIECQRLLCRLEGSAGFSELRHEHIRHASRQCRLVPSLGVRCRSEEHTTELQSLMRISYAVFCLKKDYRTAFLFNIRTVEIRVVNL